jgi:hypothetical protein
MDTIQSYDIETVDENIFVTATPQQRSIIVTLGCSIYKNLPTITCVQQQNNNNNNTNLEEFSLKQYHEREDMLQTQIKKLQEQNKTFIVQQDDEINDRLQGLKTIWITKASELEKEIARLQTSNDELKCNTEYMIRNRDADIQARTLENKSHFNESMVHCLAKIKLLEDLREQQQDTIDNYRKEKELTTHKKSRAIFVGQQGEDQVADYLESRFEEGKLINTTMNGGHGDFHFMFREMDILIEVKNKTIITQGDVSKFERDIRETKACAGIFVSIHPGVRVPLHAAFDIEIHNNEKTPVIYVTDFKTNPEMLYVAIRTVHYYVSKCLYKPESDDDPFNDSMTRFNDLVKCVKNMMPMVNDTCRYIQQASLSITKLQTFMTDEVHNLIGDEDDDDDDDHDTTTDDENYEHIMNLLESYKAIHKKLPSAKYLNENGISSKSIITHGGLKSIKTAFNQRSASVLNTNMYSCKIDHYHAQQ